MKFEQIPQRPEKNIVVNESNKEALKKHLIKYEHRINKYNADNMPVESQMDAICKKRILEHVLESGHMSTDDYWFLRQQLAERYAGDFSASAFDNAFQVIKDYAESGGENVMGGERV